MDRSLVEQAQGGDREAFAGLLRAVGDRMYAVAYRILRDPDLAQDAYQEAMIVAWRQLQSLRDPERFEAWAHRILVHACYAEARRRSRWAIDSSVVDTMANSGGDDRHDVHDRDELERAFRGLSVEHRAVFVLHHHVGLPLVEVATTLGVPQGTARSRLHYATQALRRAVDAGRAPEAVAAGEGVA
jgi:RNA polymerase sigma-70 factor, ECF subfamily